MQWYDHPIVATIGCMQDRKTELEKLIEKYSSGQLTDGERTHLIHWLHELDVSEEDIPDMKRAQNRMKEKIDARLLNIETTTKITHPSWLLLTKIAALVLFCFSFGWYLLDRNIAGDTKRRQPVKVEKTLDKSKMMTYSVVRDSVILLNDGSKVRLLANSTISLIQPFQNNRRIVQLQGRAFFEVTHDKLRPFTVVSDNILITALGTSFGVMQARKNAKPSVHLITGRVSIKERDENGKERHLAYLTPGQIWRGKVVEPEK